MGKATEWHITIIPLLYSHEGFFRLCKTDHQQLSNQSLHFLKLFAHCFLHGKLSLSMTHFQYTPTVWNVIVFEKRVNSAGVVMLTQGHSGGSRWIKAPFFMFTFIKLNLASEQCCRFLNYMTIEEKDVKGLELSVWCYNTGLAEKLQKGCVKLFGTAVNQTNCHCGFLQNRSDIFEMSVKPSCKMNGVMWQKKCFLLSH